jgi:hypothetical protein
MADISDSILSGKLKEKFINLKDNSIDTKIGTEAKVINQSTEKSLKAHLALENENSSKSSKSKKSDPPYEDFTEIIVRQIELDHETGMAHGWYKNSAQELSPVHVRVIYDGIKSVKERHGHRLKSDETKSE